MDPIIANLISGAALLATMIGGYVKLIARLTRIEARMEGDEKYRDERAADMHLRMRDVVFKYCRDECPRSSTRAITAPGGGPQDRGDILE